MQTREISKGQLASEIIASKRKVCERELAQDIAPRTQLAQEISVQMKDQLASQKKGSQKVSRSCVQQDFSGGKHALRTKETACNIENLNLFS